MATKAKEKVSPDVYYKCSPKLIHVSGLLYETFGLSQGDRVILFNIHDRLIQSQQPTKEMLKRFHRTMPLLLLYREACLASNILMTRASRTNVLRFFNSIMQSLGDE